MRVNVARYSKGIAAALGGLSEIVALGVLHGTALTVAQAVLAVATTLGVIVAPRNADPLTDGKLP